MKKEKDCSLLRKIITSDWMYAVDVVAVLFGTIFIESLLMSILLLMNISAEGNAELCLTELSLLVSVLTAAGVYLKVRGSSLLSFGWKTTHMLSRFIKSWLLVAVLMGIGFLIPLLCGSLSVASVQFVPVPLLTSLLLCFLIGLVEETFFRGFLLSRGMAYGLNPYFLLIFSSLLFAAVHIENDSVGLLSLLNIFAAGLFLGLPYLYTRNIWPSVFMHWAWNFMQGNVYGYHVSGYDFGTSILSVSHTGTPLLTGGDFGFEGSLCCTLVLAAGCLLVRRVKF